MSDELVVHAFLVADLLWATWYRDRGGLPPGALAQQALPPAGICGFSPMPKGFVARLTPHGSILLKHDPFWREEWLKRNGFPG